MQPAGVALLPPVISSSGLITDVFFSSPESSSSSFPGVNNNSSSSSGVQKQLAVVEAFQRLSDHKRSITEHYLHLIESSTDDFLARAVRVDLSALSDRYLDEPPKDMGLVQRNHDLLVHATQDAFNPHSELCTHLLDPITARVYQEHIGPLRKELESFWNRYGKLTNNQNPVLDERTTKKVLGVKEDIDHIDKMWELDQMTAHQQAEIFKTGGVSHVVPVKGLALNKVHRLLNEHQSAIEHWSSTRRAAHHGGSGDVGRGGNGSFGSPLQQFASPPAAPARKMPGAPPPPPPPRR